MKLEEARTKAFCTVKSVIDEHVIGDFEVVKLSPLRQIYVSALGDTALPNAEYKGDKLKAKLTNHYREKLSFTRLDRGNFQVYLVYICDIDVGSAVP